MVPKQVIRMPTIDDKSRSVGDESSFDRFLGLWVRIQVVGPQLFRPVKRTSMESYKKVVDQIESDLAPYAMKGFDSRAFYARPRAIQVLLGYLG